MKGLKASARRWTWLAAAIALAIAVALPTRAEAEEPVAVSPAWRVAVREEGMHRIGQEELVRAGFNPAAADARTLKVSYRGVEAAIRVPGEADGRLDPGDAILFYARPRSDRFTDVDAYWLTYGGAPGKRMAERNAAPGSAPAAGSFRIKAHAEQNGVYWQTMPGPAEADRYFWGGRLGPPGQGVETFRDYTVSLDAVAPAPFETTVSVLLKGYTAQGHRARISVNGQPLVEQPWQGQAESALAAQTALPLLKAGQNVVRVEALPSGSAPDSFLVNWIDVEYAAPYRAAGNRLAFRAPGPGRWQFAISGFSAPTAEAYDVTDAPAPVRLAGGIVEATAGGYQLRLEDGAGAATRYEALAPGGERKPLAVTLDSGSSLRNPANAADYIVISHEDFLGPAATLAAHRRGQGFRTVVVPAQDIYDEFNGGAFSPVAIRDFIRYAYFNWQRPAPGYVVLLGDAYQDYKDNLKTGTRNYVPSYSFGSSQFGEVSSDNWLAAVDGVDLLPDVALGRLAAQTVAEAEVMVGKVIAYDRQRPPGGLLLVADDDEPQFVQLSDALGALVPDRFAVRKLYAATYGPGNMRDDVVNGINAGARFVNYAGHGEHNGWGLWRGNSERIFGLDDISRLKNADRLPIVTVGDCLNGFFAGPANNPSLAEGLQRRAGGGAVAVWAPTGYGSPLGHELLLKGFYGALFGGKAGRIGDATTLAKAAAYADSPYWGELIMTYVLFGDPATEARVERKRTYLPIAGK